MLRRAAKNRLVQFLALGAVLYALASRSQDRRVVEIDPEALAAVRAAQAKRLGIASLPDEGVREVDARAIEDEVLYREALRLGLAEGDPIVKQRLVQKLLLLVEDMGGASSDPSREELRAFYEATRDRRKKHAEYTLVHVFAARPEALPPRDVLEGATRAPAAGEAFPYPRSTTASRESLRRIFGPSFADGVAKLAPGDVSEPLRSSFGWHRVRLVAIVPGAPMTLEECEKDLTLELLLDRRERVVGTYMRETVAAYEIRVGGEPLRSFVPTRRVAVRTEGSAED